MLFSIPDPGSIIHQVLLLNDVSHVLFYQEN